MKKAYIFLANGHEEVEALMVVDLLRRAGLDIATVSITGDKMVTSSHNVTYATDLLFEEVEGNMVDLVVLPGGLPGTTNLLAFEPLMKMVLAHHDAGKLVAAICAAPSVLAELGILDGKKGTSDNTLKINLSIGGTGSDVEVTAPQYSYAYNIKGKGYEVVSVSGYVVVE